MTEGLNPTADLMVVRRGGLGRTITVTVTTVVGSAAGKLGGPLTLHSLAPTCFYKEH